MKKLKSLTKSILIDFSMLLFFFILLACDNNSGVITDDEELDSSVETNSILVNISDNARQEIFLGIDAERLWYWKPAKKVELAELGVKELKSKFVRVAISPKYQLEEDEEVNPSAYDIILEMMDAMKKANPEILFFATPQPLQEAYPNKTAEDKEIYNKKWEGGTVPWSPFPTWVLNVKKQGTEVVDGNTVPKWVTTNLDVDKLIKYFSDYLNFMYDKGFVISYMDVTQEKEIITPDILVRLYNEIPNHLNDGVKMPLLIGPSSWSRYHGTEWLKGVKSEEQKRALGIASTHNTNDMGSSEEFVAEADRVGKPAWNTELHAWLGTAEETELEVLSSEIFWEHMRAGFTGLSTWLFYGPEGGKGHTMIWSSTKPNVETVKSAKYEIFKTMVNSANGGYYVPIEMPDKDVITSAFIKDNVLTIWALNKADVNKKIKFVIGKRVANKELLCKYWNGDLPRSGIETKFEMLNDNSFVYDCSKKTLYYYELKLK